MSEADKIKMSKYSAAGLIFCMGALSQILFYLVEPTGGCSSEVPDEIAKEVIKEVIDKYGPFALDELKEACLRHESGCGNMADCQTCGDLKCLMKIPATLAAFNNCLKMEYS